MNILIILGLCIFKFINASDNDILANDYTCKARDCFNSSSCLYIKKNFNENIDYSTIDVKDINHIFSHYFDLHEIPDDILFFENLAYLSIISSEFVTLSKNVNKLKKLERLHIDRYTIDKIDGSIKNLKNLQKLTIRNDNQKFFFHKELPITRFVANYKDDIKELKFEKGDFINLKELFICIRYQTIKSLLCKKTQSIKNIAEFHSLKQIPDEICFLQNLTELNITSHEIKYIPENIGNLKNLKILNLNHNCLYEIPKSFRLLVNLERLYMSNNSFCKIDNSISNLVNLNELDFSFNFNSKSEYFFEDNLSFDFSKLKKLQILNLAALKISRLHKSIFLIRDSIKSIDLSLTSLADDNDGEYIGKDTLFYIFEDRLIW